MSKSSKLLPSVQVPEASFDVHASGVLVTCYRPVDVLALISAMKAVPTTHTTPRNTTPLAEIIHKQVSRANSTPLSRAILMLTCIANADATTGISAKQLIKATKRKVQRIGPTTRPWAAAAKTLNKSRSTFIHIRKIKGETQYYPTPKTPLLLAELHRMNTVVPARKKKR